MYRYRQLNSPKEIVRRLVFLMYILFSASFVIELFAAFGRPAWQDLTAAVGSFLAAALLREIGYRRLDFYRLFESFPMGCVRDSVPEKVRSEVECLIDEFYSGGTDWVRRGAIRRRLRELEEEQPEIADAYSEDLHRVLAA